MATTLNVTLTLSAQDRNAVAAVKALTKAVRENQDALAGAENAAARAGSATDRLGRSATGANAGFNSAGAAANRAASGVRVMTKEEIRLEELSLALNAALREQVQRELGITGAEEAAAKATRDHANAQLALGASAGGNAELVGLLTRRVLGLLAAFQAARALTAFVEQGFKFNSMMEQSTLGIAALITAQAQLKDSDGKLLTGAEALAAAQQIAVQQMQLLRVEGVRTHATTTDLVLAFQQAVGVGLRFGLTLEQTRKITIGMVQAAFALQVPLNQLNEEIRDFLAGNISPRNTRIAAALNITNEQVKSAQNAGKLFEFVQQKLAAFNATGEATTHTLVGITSNIRMFAEQLAGAANKGLFDAFEKNVGAALEKAFNINTGQLAPQFVGLADIASAAGRVIGQSLAGALNLVIETSKDLSAWFTKHREQLGEIGSAALVVARDLAQIVGVAIRIAAQIVTWGIESGVFAGILRTVDQIFQFIADHVGLITTALLLWQGPAIVGGIFALATAVTTFAAGLSPLLAIVAALGLAAVAFNAFGSAADAATQKSKALIGAQGDQQAKVAALATKFAGYADQLSRGNLTMTERVRLEGALKEAQQQLLDIAPEYGQALADHAGKLKEQAAAVRDLTAAEVDRLRIKSRLATQESRAASQAAIDAKAELDAAKQVGDIHSIPRLQANFDRLDAEAKKAQGSANALWEAWAKVDEAVKKAAEATKPVTVINPPRVPTEEELAKAAELAKAKAEEMVKAAEQALKQQEADLKAALDANAISYQRYFQSLTAAQQAAILAQIEANRTVLAQPGLKPDDRAKIRGEQERLNADLLNIQIANNRQLTAAQKKLNDDRLDLEIQFNTAIGREGDARALQLEKQFRDLRQRLKVEGDVAGVQLIDALINIGKARANLEQLQREVSRVRDDTARQEQSIDARAEAGVITRSQARQELLDVYTKERDRLQELVGKMQAVAEATHNAFDQQQVADFQAELERLKIKIADLSDQWKKVRDGAFDALQSALSTYLQSDITKVKSLLDAIIDLAQQINRVLADTISESLVDLLRERIRKGLANALAGGAIDNQLNQIFAKGIPGIQVIGQAASATSVAATGAAQAATQTAAVTAQSTAIGSAVSAAMTPGLTELTTAAGTMTTLVDALAPIISALGDDALELGIAARALIEAAAALAGKTLADTGKRVAEAISAGGNVVAAAGGGWVLSPGAPTTVDTIPAMLANREYIQPATSVDYYGPGVHEAMAQRRIPRELFAHAMRGVGYLAPRVPRTARFSEGGLVQAALQSGSKGTGPSTRSETVLRLLHSRDAVLQVLRGPDGQRIIMQAIADNPTSVRAALALDNSLL